MSGFIKFLLAALMGVVLQLGLAGMASAQDGQEKLDAFLSAQEQFEKGLRGTGDDNEKASGQFEKLVADYPGNPLFLAYYGSTFTIKANHVFLPWQRLKLGDKGLDMIDKALKQLTPEHETELVRGVPVSIETKLVAINTFLAVPDVFFHRYEPGKKLLEETMASPAFANAPPIIQARFHYQAAFVAKKSKDKAAEIKELKKTLELDPQGKDVAAAQSRLKELGA